MKNIFKRKKKPLSPHGRRKLPDEVCSLLEAGGLDVSGISFFVKGDMDFEGCFCTTWAMLDSKGLYIATGTEELRRKRGNKRLQCVYTIDKIVSYPLDDIDKLKTEQYVSTGRLIAESGGEDCGVLKFSVGLVGEFDKLCRALDCLKNGKEIPPDIWKGSTEQRCPKCGRPYPPHKDVCPNCIGKTSTMKRLFQFFSGYKSTTALIVLALIIRSAVGIVTPQISTRTLFDGVLANVGQTPQEQLFVALAYLVGAVIGIKLLDHVLNFAFTYMIGSIMPRLIYDIKLKIFSAMQRLSVGFFSSKQTGSLMENVTRDANNIYWFFVEGMPYIITNVALLIGVVIFMLAMSWKLTMMIAAALPAVFLLLMLWQKLFRVLHHRNWNKNAQLTSMVSDNINGQRVIKAFSKEDDELKRFNKANDSVRDAELRLANTEVTVFPLFNILISILEAVVLAVGGTMVVSGELTVGTLLSFIIYLSMLAGPLDFLSWVFNWWARCVDSAQRVFEIVDTEPDVCEAENPIDIGEIKGEIEISELEFEYEPARPIIKKLSLKAEAGEMLGIVGKTGAGKTTIANLISRLYDAKAGVVKIDDVDVKDMPLKKLRTGIGLVSQDIYLFIGTIADNIRYAKPDATMDEVIAAAKAAAAHDFIMKLPDAYETRVGAGGQDLSGGERQRISIARTIIQNPRILILDEATAAMDTETERNIQRSLTELMHGRTTIAIAHRLSTLRDADMLAVIDGGEVTEYGSYADMLRQKGEFYKLYKIQSEALKAVGISE